MDDCMDMRVPNGVPYLEVSIICIVLEMEGLMHIPIQIWGGPHICDHPAF